jgi:hypothetical protein
MDIAVKMDAVISHETSLDIRQTRWRDVTEDRPRLCSCRLFIGAEAKGVWGKRMYSSCSFSTSALDGGEWSASRPGRVFTPGERTPGTHCTGGWVGLRAGLDTEARGKVLSPAGDRTPIARSSSP